MAMTTCSECGASVSDKAQTCPKCGNPIATISAASQPTYTGVHAKPPKKKHGAVYWLVMIFIVIPAIISIPVAIVLIKFDLLEVGSGAVSDSGSSVSIDSASEAEEYILENIPLADGVNKGQGVELFALGTIDEGQAIFSATATNGETIEGYYVDYIENLEFYPMIVTYDGSVYVAWLNGDATAATALYTKMYDAQEGWLGNQASISDSVATPESEALTDEPGVEQLLGLSAEEVVQLLGEPGDIFELDGGALSSYYKNGEFFLSLAVSNDGIVTGVSAFDSELSIYGVRTDMMTDMAIEQLEANGFVMSGTEASDTTPDFEVVFFELSSSTNRKEMYIDMTTAGKTVNSITITAGTRE